MHAATGVIPLDFVHLGLACALVLVAGGVSVFLRLGLERQLAVASARTVVQLLLIGYVLRYVFRLESLPLIALVLLAMTAGASHAAVQRANRRYPRMMGHAFVTLAASGLITCYMVTGLIVGVKPWYRPQYAIPLLGMILGNGLTGISLCLDQLLEALTEGRAQVEMELAHGASRWEAALPPLRAAVRRGMIPTINAMLVVGIVSLPGMMTGQILSGTDPLVAVKYQIVVMFMLAAATALGCIGVAILVYRRLFNVRHQLTNQVIAK